MPRFVMPHRAAFMGCFAQPLARDARWERVCVTYSGICWCPGYVCLCCLRCVPACSCIWAMWQASVADDGEKICSKIGACGSTLGCELCTTCWCQACLQIPAQGPVQSMCFNLCCRLTRAVCVWAQRMRVCVCVCVQNKKCWAPLNSWVFGLGMGGGSVQFWTPTPMGWAKES